MSIKEAISRIFSASGYRSRLLSYPVLTVLMVAEAAGLAVPSGGPGEYRAVCAAQFALFVVSACFFRGLCLMLTDGRLRPAFWLTAVYCLTPSFLYWTTVASWDMPRLASTVALVWAAARILRSNHAGLRLVKVVAVPVVMVFCAVITVDDWPGRKFRLACDMGLMRVEHTGNMALRAEISRIYGGADVLADNGRDLYLYTHEVPDPELIPVDDVEAAAGEALAGRGPEVARHLIRRLQWVVRGLPVLYVPDNAVTEFIAMMFYPTVGLYVLFLTGMAVWLIVRWRRGVREGLPWLLLMSCMAVAWTALLCLTDEWARYMTPCMPMTLLLIYHILRRLRFAPRKLL